MLFNSWQFALFFPIVFSIYWVIPSRYQYILLGIASYYFYMSWDAKYVFLILFTTIVSYYSAHLLYRSKNIKVRKRILTVALIICFGVLFFFKYLNFFFNTLNSIFSLVALPIQEYTRKIVLPVGISFYTFQCLSYVIDVYRGNCDPETHFGYFATFISFFPQLVAGPIERTNNLLPQIKKEHTFNYTQVTYGLILMGWGFFKKILVADALAPFADQVFNNVASYQGFVFIIATFLQFKFIVTFLDIPILHAALRR